MKGFMTTFTWFCYRRNMADLFGIYSTLGIITWHVPSVGFVQHPDEHKAFQAFRGGCYSSLF